MAGSDISDDNVMMNADAPLAGPKWSEPTIDWQHYTYQTKPTVAAHARDVARQASAARSTNRETTDNAMDGDYLPNESCSSRNLCLATVRGSLIDFFIHSGPPVMARALMME